MQIKLMMSAELAKLIEDHERLFREIASTLMNSMYFPIREYDNAQQTDYKFAFTTLDELVFAYKRAHNYGIINYKHEGQPGWELVAKSKQLAPILKLIIDTVISGTYAVKWKENLAEIDVFKVIDFQERWEKEERERKTHFYKGKNSYEWLEASSKWIVKDRQEDPADYDMYQRGRCEAFSEILKGLDNCEITYIDRKNREIKERPSRENSNQCQK